MRVHLKQMTEKKNKTFTRLAQVCGVVSMRNHPRAWSGFSVRLGHMEWEGFFHLRSSIASELVRKKKSSRSRDKVEIRYVVRPQIGDMRHQKLLDR